MKLLVGTDCSGIEAPLQALEIMGVKYEHVFCSEINQSTRQVALATYGPAKYECSDITERDHSKLPHVDLYVAGFPCQAFSHMGKRGGFDDYKGRGLIFFECYETIKATRPKVFILENVKGLVTHDKGLTFHTILSYLGKLREYYISYKILNAADYGVPQNRERIFIVGIRKDVMCGKFSFPKEIKLTRGVSDLLDMKAKPTELTQHKVDILNDLLDNGIIDDLSKPWVVNLNCSSYRRSSPMLDVSPCLMASGAIYYITSESRNLTPYEFLKLQGFHRLNFNGEYSKIYGMAGNSMCVSVLIHLFKSIFKVVHFRRK